MALTKTKKRRVGNRDKRVDFENWVESGGDGMGGSEGSWQTETILYAGITPISGREKIHMDAVDSNITHSVEIRWNEFDISGKSRITWGNRKFNLKYVLNEGEDDAYFEIAAVEEQ